MNRVSKPASCAETPIQRKWLWMRSSSATTHANSLGTGWGLDVRQLLNCQAICQGMNMRADATYTLEQVQVLHPVARLDRFFNTTVGISQADIGIGDDLTIYSELEVPRLFQRRVLRSNWNDELYLKQQYRAWVSSSRCGQRLHVESGWYYAARSD